MLSGILATIQPSRVPVRSGRGRDHQLTHCRMLPTAYRADALLNARLFEHKRMCRLMIAPSWCR